VDPLAARLAGDCPCTGESEVIPTVEFLAGGLLSAEVLTALGVRTGADMGSAIPQDELPLALLFRMMDDGLTSGLKYIPAGATRRPDLGRAFFKFGIEGIVDVGVVYVVDEASNRICCKSEVDRVAAHLTRVCPCIGEGVAVPLVNLFGNDFMYESERAALAGHFPIHLGPTIPQDDLPLALLDRAMADGAASGQRLKLINATRRTDLGRAFLTFGIEGHPDPGMLYVLDEASGRICCKSETSTMMWRDR
jgi:hypothetical protein